MQPPPKGQFQAGVPTQQASGQDLKAQAVGRAGTAISQTADLEMELQMEQDRQDMTDAELMMRKESERIANDLAMNFNPSTHREEASKRFDSAINNVMSGRDFRPSFQNEMAKRLDMFKSAKLEKISEDAKLMQLENGKRLHMARVDSYRADGDLDEAKRLLDEGVGTYYPSEVAEVGKMRIDRDQRNDFYDQKVMEGDVDFFSGDDLPGLSKGDQMRMKAKAETSIARNESREVDKISGAMAIGEIRTKEDLARNLEGAQYIKPATAKILLKNWDNNKPLSFDEKKTLSDKMNNLHADLKKGVITREAYEKGHHLIASEVYALGDRSGSGGLRTRIHQLDPTKWKPGNLEGNEKGGREVEIEMMAADFDRAGGFGKVMSGDDDDMSAGEMMAANSKARSVREITEMAMKEWLKTEEGQKATGPQIRNQFMKEAAAAMVGRDVESVSKYESDYERIMKIGVLPPK